MNEDHKELVVLSDSHCRLYNDNHVLLKSGLLNEPDQENIEDLYENEVKPFSTAKEDTTNQEMKPPSPA